MKTELSLRLSSAQLDFAEQVCRLADRYKVSREDLYKVALEGLRKLPNCVDLDHLEDSI